jgi:hypothetical protein
MRGLAWIAVAGAGLGVVVSLSGCTRTVVVTAPPTVVASPPSPESVPPSVASTTEPPATQPPTKAPATHFYADAKQQWKKGATAISAQQGLYWSKAASDLHSGIGTDPGDTSGYQKRIDELKELISLPDAQQTPAQNAQYHADIDDLNTFFGTPGLYS